MVGADTPVETKAGICWLAAIPRGKMAILSTMEIFSQSEWVELVSELSLSARQAEVTRHLLAGYSDKQIAMEMQISVAGVRSHLSRLFSKFELQDRHELVLYVFRYFRERCRTNGCPLYQ